VVADQVGRTYRVGDSDVGLWAASLRIAAGELVSVVGPSGSGKSTLLNLLGLLDTPSRGSLKLFGVDVGSMRPRERAAYRSTRIAFVFQSFHLSPKRSIAENVADGLLFCCPRKGRLDRVTDALKLVGLEGREHQGVETVSGGERQRVAVARALAKTPELLLADEPTGNLDRQNGQTIFDLLRETAQRGAAVVVVTHDLELAAEADRILVVSDGRINDGH
jgi:putative ABC transport system ATP-binding protein